jgi:hypothetical protein
MLGFTISLAFGKKLERIIRNPRVAVAYHAREHGLSTSQAIVLAQGTASVDLKPEVSGETAVYAPHTSKGFTAPPLKNLMMVMNGLLAKYGMRQARRRGTIERLEQLAARNAADIGDVTEKPQTAHIATPDNFS